MQYITYFVVPYFVILYLQSNNLPFMIFSLILLHKEIPMWKMEAQIICNSKQILGLSQPNMHLFSYKSHGKRKFLKQRTKLNCHLTKFHPKTANINVSYVMTLIMGSRSSKPDKFFIQTLSKQLAGQLESKN